MTDYAGLKAEIAEPEYDGMTDAQIAASLTTPFVITVDASPQAAYNIVMRSVTYDWGRVLARGKLPLAGDAGDDVILAALNFAAAFQSSMIVLHTSIAEDLAKLQSDLTTLQVSGDVSQESADAILALTQGNTTRAEQLGFDLALHDMDQEIAAARIWTP